MQVVKDFYKKNKEIYILTVFSIIVSLCITIGMTFIDFIKTIDNNHINFITDIPFYMFVIVEPIFAIILIGLALIFLDTLLLSRNKLFKIYGKKKYLRKIIMLNILIYLIFISSWLYAYILLKQWDMLGLNSIFLSIMQIGIIANGTVYILRHFWDMLFHTSIKYKTRKLRFINILKFIIKYSLLITFIWIVSFNIAPIDYRFGWYDLNFYLLDLYYTSACIIMCVVCILDYIIFYKNKVFL